MNVTFEERGLNLMKTGEDSYQVDLMITRTIRGISEVDHIEKSQAYWLPRFV